MNLTINRTRWARRGIRGQSLLRNERGNMCCLGFLGRACGIKPAALTGMGIPWALDQELRAKYPKGANKHFGELAGINDDKTKSDAEREATIKRLMKKFGVNVRFTG